MKKYTAVAVIGGTYNPTTMAHINLGVLAAERLHVDQVVYVPSKTEFLKEWKQMSSKEILSDETRIALLQQSIAECTRLTAVVDDCEITGESSGKTYDTLKLIKEKYHADQVYWVMGSDKLDELHRWYRSEELMKQYQFMVIQRDGDYVEELIAQDPWLSNFQNQIITCPAQENMQTISATKVRNAMKTGALEQIKELVPKAVYLYLKDTLGNK